MKLLLPRRRFLLGGAALICAPAIIPARAQLTLTGAGKGAVGGGGGATTTFDPAHTSTNITLSGGNLTVVNLIGSVNGDLARTVASHSTGKFYNEYTVTGDSLVGYDMSLSLLNGAHGVTNATIGQGGDTGSLQNATADPNIYINGSSVGNTGLTFASGDVYGIAVSLTAMLIWVRKNGGNWNNNAGYAPDGTGGIDISTLTGGPFYAAVSIENPTNQWVANFGGSAYGTAAPSGYGNW
jgi:hypothetical protein